MSVKRKQFSAEFKTKLVLELLQGDRTLSEICSKYKVHPQSLAKWKKQFLSNASLAFDKSSVVKEYKEEVEKLSKEKERLAKKLDETIIERDWAVGKLKSLDLSTKKALVDKEGVQAEISKNPSLNKRLEMLSVSKCAYYYKPVKPFSSMEEVSLLHKIDEIYTEFPYYGYRRIKFALERAGINIGFKKTISAMRHICVSAIYPKKKTTLPNKYHKKYPYLLDSYRNSYGNVEIEENNAVWSGDITYIRLATGYAYLAAIIDWHSKKILSWKLSNVMDTHLAVSVLEEALCKYDAPEIFNSDQGSQYTSLEHIEILKKNNISISMNSKGRSIDNIVIERFFRSLKYEEVYLKNYETLKEARMEIGKYINKYNSLRLHSSIGNITPDECYFNYEFINEINAA